MHARVAVAAFVLLAPVAQASGLPVSFQSPAQVGGEADAQNLDWALLLFHGAPATFRLEAGPATHVNHTVLLPVTDLPDGSRVVYDRVLPDSTTPYPDGLAAEVSFTGAGWGSLYVEADALRFAPAGIDGSVFLLGRKGTVQEVLPGVGQPVDAVRPRSWFVPGDEPLVSFRPNRTSAASFRLEAVGLRTVEWHGASLACANACPDGAWTENRTFGASGASISLLTTHYGELDTATGALRGEGAIVAAAAGSAALGLGVKGWVRLPLADLEGPCAGDCPSLDDQTLWAEGELFLDGVRMRSGAAQRMEADLDGSAASARFDEAPVSLETAVVSATAAGFAVALGLALWRLLGAFFTRHTTPGQALDDPVRRRVYEAVCGHPGCTYRDLMRLTGLSDGGVRRHLRVLERHGHVVSNTLGRKRRLYFENHGRYAKTWRSKAVLRDPVQQALLEQVSRNPGWTQADVVAYAFQAHRLSRTAARHRLYRLVEWGLLEEARDGRMRRYWPAVPAS